MIPVILSGGSGTRLWPISREIHPKQFLQVIDHQTLFQATVQRAAALEESSNPLVVCNENHRFLVAEQLRELGIRPSRIVLEPVPRGTAAAVASAALEALKSDPNAVLLVLPSDHLLRDEVPFQAAVQTALQQARNGALVTFGIRPYRPETGYGYIRVGTPREGSMAAFAVAQFVEKPDRATAAAYLASGDYLWNSGMFAFRAKTYLDTLKQLAPEILGAVSEADRQAKCDLDFLRLDRETFSRARSDSIDCAVMERAENVVVVPLDAGWNDVGSWHAVVETADADENDNVLIGDVFSEKSRGCYLRSEHRLLAAIGVKDLIVVETADAVLVASPDHAQQVRAVVQFLKEQERPEWYCHRRVHRPWGSFEELFAGERFRVKRLEVNPGGTLSLQRHNHRAEHWVVVKGSATVRRGDEKFTLGEDQSTYIPVRCMHQLSNPGTTPLEIIEVQSGSYLGEDDIERFDDPYGRS